MKPLRKTTPCRSALSSTMLASSSRELGLPLDDVVIVFACSESFVPYLSVAVQSIVENASATRRYDIIVLTRDLSPTTATSGPRPTSAFWPPRFCPTSKRPSTWTPTSSSTLTLRSCLTST